MAPQPTQPKVKGVDRVQRLFDAKAPAWGEKYAPGAPLEWRAGLFTRVARRVVPAGGRILDFGCGTGVVARRLTEAGFDVAGCDFSPAMIDHARSGAGIGIQWMKLEASWRHLPLDDRWFDAAIASSVLEYVPDVGMTLAELARVTRPRGHLIVSLPNPRHPIRRMENVLQRLPARPLATVGAASTPRIRRFVDYLATSVNRMPLDEWAQCLSSYGWEVVGREHGSSSLAILIAQRS